MLRVIEATPKEFGEEITLGDRDETIAEDIMNNGSVYCIKNCLRQEPIDNLRKELFEYYNSIPQTKIIYDGSTANMNYHSIEKGVSPLQKSLHYFHGYVFNRIADLPLRIRPSVEGVFTSLASFYNYLTRQERALKGVHADGRQFRPQIFQYPVGGGMFSTHIHPLEPQKIGIILGLSKRGRDFNDGGAGFETPDGTLVDTSSTQDIGDIVLFRYDLKHWVTPCDIHSPLDDNKNNGRWSAVLPIY